MTLREQLTEKKDALVALKERIEAEDTEAIEEADELTEAIETLEKSIEAAEKAKEKLAVIGNDEEPEEETGMEENSRHAGGTEG